MRRLLLCLLLATVATGATTEPFPGYVGISSNAQAFPAADTMYCHQVTVLRDLSGTKFGGNVRAGSGATTTGFAIYLVSNDTQIAEAFGSSAAAGNITATGLTYTLTAGTRIWVCACTTSTAVQYSCVDDDATGAGHWGSLLNGSTTTVATATNTCSSGNPPSTMNGSSAATNFRLPLVVAE